MDDYLDDLESKTLAEALAASENDWTQASARSERESEQVARRLYDAELGEVDHELARALESSISDHDVHQERFRLNEELTDQQDQRAADRHTGSWDCPECTYTNEPFQKKCKACHAEPPPQMLVFSEMSRLRFGLEIEIIIPCGLRDGFSLTEIARRLTAMGPPKVEYGGDRGKGASSKRARMDANGGYKDGRYNKDGGYKGGGCSHETSLHWKLVTDTSLVGADDDLCFELVSPVLMGEEGLMDLRILMENVRRLGIATNTTCGFHVHVDASRDEEQTVPSMSTLRGIQRVARCFLALENAFDLLVALSWESMDNTRRANHNRYCQSNRLALGQCSNKQRWERISGTQSFSHLVRLINPDRYRKLNITNITDPSRPSTCEFRNHGGVEDAREAESWVRLLLRFCEKANALNDTTCLLFQGAGPKEEIRALFDLLDCNGLEQFFMFDRKLFLDSRLQNLWTCSRCDQVFRDSRSLSQHCNAKNHH